MASQQVLIAETIAGMKRALKRRPDDDESETEVEYSTNRGNKLKKGSRFIRKGHLTTSSGPTSYREVIEHAGYRRAIISRNPPLIDEEGYEIDSDEDDDRVQEAMMTAADVNPFGAVRIEELLAPLTSVADLSNHPTLSRPYTSKALTELAEHAGDLTHKENASLWKVKHLLTRLCGDYDWVPGERLLGENDIELFSDDLLARILPREPAALDVNAAKQERTNGETAAHAESGSTQPGQAESSGAAPKERSSTEAEQKNGSGESGSLEETATKSDPDASVAGQKDEPPDARGPDGAEKAPEQSTDAEQVKEDKNGTSPAHANGVGSEMDVDPPTEAPAADKVAAEDSASSPAQTMDETPEEPLIHPYFLAPPSARPDKDLGLPEQEADDVRRLLQMYVQKQEEICRGMRRLHEGLLRADRLRRTVLKWSKAEAHVGPNRDMSDGEDWYDKEEWGLEEDLKKGHDEEEEDNTTVPTVKKTRNRRG